MIITTQKLVEKDLIYNRKMTLRASQTNVYAFSSILFQFLRRARVSSWLLPTLVSIDCRRRSKENVEKDKSLIAITVCVIEPSMYIRNTVIACRAYDILRFTNDSYKDTPCRRIRRRDLPFSIVNLATIRSIFNVYYIVDLPLL